MSRSTSLPGTASSRAREPNTAMRRISGWSSARRGASSRRACQTASLSKYVTFTEPKYSLRILDGPFRLASGVGLARRAMGDGVRIARWYVMLVQLLGRIHQLRGHLDILGQGGHQVGQEVAPSVRTALLEERLQRLFGPLLGREARPLVELAVQGCAGVLHVPSRLPEPVLVARRPATTLA